MTTCASVGTVLLEEHAAVQPLQPGTNLRRDARLLPGGHDLPQPHAQPLRSQGGLRKLLQRGEGQEATALQSRGR